MATTTHGDPQPLRLESHDEDELDEESWDENIEVLLASGDIEGARAELERQCLVSLDSGKPIDMTPEKWEELRLELQREAIANHRLPGYTIDLLLEKGDIPAAKAELERLLLEGISSEGSVEATPQFFEDLREDIHRKAQAMVTGRSA